MLANEQIEPLRRDKTIRSSLEAEYSYPGDPGDTDLAEIFIVAAVHPKRETAVTRTTHHKCGRCWRHLPDVAEDGTLCSRCDKVVAGMDAA
jgi:isoleucyl-tRNA synthetase